MTEAEIINHLKKNDKFFEVYHKKFSFECHRHTKDEGEQEVLVEILDSGSDAESAHHRYLCVATTKDGRRAIGQSQPSIELALALVHWEKLDKKR